MSEENVASSAQSGKSAPLIGKGLLLPFLFIVLLFPLWGFANDITNPMVAAFKNILLISNFESSLVQSAFYGGYALMAVPAAIFIKRFSYKAGVLIGLALYALGCLLFIPSAWTVAFVPFLLAYLIMTCGLSFLETTANPYILSLGSEETATRRLNFAQSFNPMGSIIGMFVASMCILVNLSPETENARRLREGVLENDATITAQFAAQQADIAAGMAALTADGDWRANRKVMKRLSDRSTILANNLDLLSDPKYAKAQEVSAAIAAQPTRNKFAEAAVGVAEVLQLREKTPPTPAETLREREFYGADGLELALLLGKEQAGTPFSAENFAARFLLAETAKDARAVSDKLDDAYWHHKEASLDPAAVRAELERIAGNVAVAHRVFAETPASALDGGNYVAETKKIFDGIQKQDLDTVVLPYALMGGVLLFVLALFAWKLPASSGASEGGSEVHFFATLKRLLKNARYIEGVVAQLFYVGVQIMVWTFIIQYAEATLGLSKATAQNCNILAMVIFVSSRFVCTFFLRYVNAGILLFALAVGGGALVMGTIWCEGYLGLYCLIGVSACMSLMFPTIYGIALGGLGDDAKLGSAGLIMAIGGGCLMPPLQGFIIDMPPFELWGGIELASVRASFILPFICFVVIALYGLRSIPELARRRGKAAS